MQRGAEQIAPGLLLLPWRSVRARFPIYQDGTATQAAGKLPAESHGLFNAHVMFLFTCITLTSFVDALWGTPSNLSAKVC